MLYVNIFWYLLLIWLHWAKISIEIPIKIFLQWVKWIYKKETFKTDLNWIMSRDVFMMLVGKWLKLWFQNKSDILKSC